MLLYSPDKRYYELLSHTNGIAEWLSVENQISDKINSGLKPTRSPTSHGTSSTIASTSYSKKVSSITGSKIYVLRTMPTPRDVVAFRPACIFACCLSATLKASTRNVASPGGVPIACRCETSSAINRTRKRPTLQPLAHCRPVAAGSSRGGVSVRARNRR